MAVKIAKSTPGRKAPKYGKVERPESGEENVAKTITNWVLFWLVAGIEIAKDVLDILWAALEGLGVGLTATILGSVVGIPLIVLAVGAGWMVSLLVFIITMTYFFYTKQSVLLRLVIISISTIIGMIPALDIIPEATVGFFIATFASQIVKVAKVVVGGVAGKVLSVGSRVIT